MKWNVAITGMNARPENPGPGYGVARCLRRWDAFAGRIVGLGYDVLDAGLYHKDINAGYLLPYPATGEEAMLERILEVHENERLDAIIPCLDAELPIFVALEERLRQHGIRTFLPSAQMLQRRSKDRLQDLCREVGVLTPETKTVTDARHFREGIEYPVVVKGVFYDAYVVHTPEQAEAAFHKLARQWGYPVLVQKFLAGTEYNLTALGDGQGLVGSVMMRKRALTEKGKAWAGVTVVDEQLERLAGSLVGALKWKGPLEVEALKCEDDGRFYLIEINPRFPAWIYLSQAVGRNLPAMLLQMMAREPLGRLNPLEPGKMFIRFAEELVVDMAAFENLTMQGALCR